MGGVGLRGWGWGWGFWGCGFGYEGAFRDGGGVWRRGNEGFGVDGGWV